MTAKQDINAYLVSGATSPTGSSEGFPAEYLWWLRRLIEDEAGARGSSSTVVTTGTRAIMVTIDSGGLQMVAGVKGEFSIPIAATITGWVLVADQVGSGVIDIWKDTYTNFPPTVADSITASAKPTLSSADKNRDTVLTGWTTAIAAGDTFRINVDSVSGLTRMELTLTIET